MKTIAVRFLSIAVLTVFLVACGAKLTQDNFNKISNGMPYAEVVKLLGEPQSSDGGGAFGITASTST
jgi:outer membrane protein assembly factor BamE (lipoprotein component of BamABCDE complex)